MDTAEQTIGFYSFDQGSGDSSRLIEAGKRGERWARERATGGQLRRLASYRNAVPAAPEIVKDWSSARVGIAILGEAGDGRIKQFWAEAFDSDGPSDDEVACFVVDALGTWRHVL